MNPIVLAVVSVTGIGLICAVILAAASKLMAVQEDKRALQLRAVLPGANCGACGYAGCDGYAKALADGENSRTNLCIPGGDGVSRQLSDLLGVAFQDVVEQVAVVRCRGDCGHSRQRMTYRGTQTCAAAHLTFAGPSACANGCIGLGDCARVCPQDAICIQNGIAHVDPRRCVGCGLCAKTCPSRVIDLIADVDRALVVCNNHSGGAVSVKNCDAGCVGCRLCEKACPEHAVSVVNRLAVIDYAKCTGCGQCAAACRRGCIVIGDFRGALSI